MYMLCRNRVTDYSRWKRVFASHQAAHIEAGLRLTNIWRAVDDANNVFYVFEVGSKDKAQRFINNPDAAKAADSSGVLEGEYHFVEDAGGY
jgi:hypothetical protein